MKLHICHKRDNNYKHDFIADNAHSLKYFILNFQANALTYRAVIQIYVSLTKCLTTQYVAPGSE